MNPAAAARCPAPASLIAEPRAEQEEVSSVSSVSSVYLVHSGSHTFVCWELAAEESWNPRTYNCSHVTTDHALLRVFSELCPASYLGPASDGPGWDSASGDKWSYRRCVDSQSHRYLLTQISTHTDIYSTLQLDIPLYLSRDSVVRGFCPSEHLWCGLLATRVSHEGFRIFHNHTFSFSLPFTFKTTFRH